MSKYNNLIYSHIAENIEIYMAQHRLKPGDRLPSEREFAEKWNVSRMTVRSAFEKLIDDGLLYSIRGSGTFVASKKVIMNLGESSSFTDTIKRQRLSLKTSILSTVKIEANKELAKVFHVTLGTEFFELTRVRIVDGIPFAVERSYLLFKQFSGIDQFDFTNRSLFELLEVNYHVKIANQKHYIHSGPLSSIDFQTLGLEEGSIGLFLDSHGLDAEGNIVVYTKERVRPDRCVIKSVSREKD